MRKHRFQQATALSWGCLGSSEHPVPVPAGASQHDSGLLHLLPQWASAEEWHCCSLCGFCLSAQQNLLLSPKCVPSPSCSDRCVQCFPLPNSSSKESGRPALEHSNLSTGSGCHHKSPVSSQARQGELSPAAGETPESLRPGVLWHMGTGSRLTGGASQQR